MIKANELRIDNLVYGVSDRIEEICAITEGTVTTRLPTLKESMFTTSLSDISEIEITGEFLLKFGFTYDYVFCDMILIMQKDKMLGYDTKNGGLFLAYHKEKDFRDIRIATVNYVHQLQNIYFALTNEELTIKP